MYYNINRAQTQVFFNNYLVDLFLRDSSVILRDSSIYFSRFVDLFNAIRRFVYTRFVGRFTETCRASYEGLSLRLRKSAAANDIKKRGYKSISRVFCLSFYLFGINRFRFICPLSWRASRSESQAPRRPRPRTPLSTFRKPREVRKRKEQARRI